MLKKDALLVPTESYTRFSILIPFRNEASCLPGLLLSIKKIKYPKNQFEILLINDDSTDASASIIACFIQENPQLNLCILNNHRSSGSPKKDALGTALNRAKNPWILCTDADCLLPKNWLIAYHSKIQKHQNLRFIAGPVAFWNKTNTALNAFQQLDFLSLQGATIGGFGLRQPFMCNGANLGFLKTEFIKQHGYSSNNQIASGDDVFLMQQFAKADRSRVSFLKTEQALVYTAPQPDWPSLINQRKRWASKASAYTGWFAILTAMVVLLGNASVIAGIFFTKIYSLLILKVAVDFILIRYVAKLFAQTKPLRNYLWIALIHPFFTVYVAISSQLGSFTWKDRVFNK